jgi:hypothetical protein
MSVMDSAMRNMGDGIFRQLLNGYFDRPDFTLDNLVICIDDDTSLWETGKHDIEAKAAPFKMFFGMAASYIGTVEKQYGNVANLALEWLKIDHPSFYSLIVTTPGGVEWFEEQVNDILKGLNIT